MRLAALIAAVLSVVVARCGGGGERLHLAPVGGATTTPQPPSPAPTPPAPPALAGVEVYDVTIVPPGWLAAADVPPLEVAVAEYLDDAAAALAGWRPAAGSSGAFPLSVVLHDVRGANVWDVATRTAWLEWPRGASGKPVAVAFAPLLHHVLVLDRKRERGTTHAPWTREEIDAAARGRNLQVRLNAARPQDFD